MDGDGIGVQRSDAIDAFRNVIKLFGKDVRGGRQSVRLESSPPARVK